MTSNTINNEVVTNKKTLIVSMTIIAVIALILVVFPEQSKLKINAVFAWMTNQFDFAFLIIGFLALIFLLFLGFSSIGNIKFGEADQRPEFSWSAWGAMVFLAGIASGLILWGAAEWPYLYTSPPFAMKPKTPEVYTVAQAFGIFHWGPTAWAIYCIPAIAMSYMYYVRKKHIYKVSESCRGALGCLVDGPVGSIINYLFIFGILGAAATSLGLGTPMIGGALSTVFSIEHTTYLDVGIIIACTTVFTLSSGLGLDKGIKRLSYIGTLISLSIVVYILVVGPTHFMVGLGLDSMSYMFNNYIKMSLWTDTIGKSGFPQGWTVFFWAWWVAYAPFMGMFVTRISLGRTIREVIFGMLFFGTAGCALFYIVLGGYGIHLQMENILAVAELVNTQGTAQGIIAILATLPLAKVVLIAVAVSGIILLAATFDSAAYVIACTSTLKLEEGQEPKRGNRLFWCGAIAILPIVLLFLGGLKTMQTTSVLVGLPLMFILVLMMITTMRLIKEDRLKLSS